MTKASSSSTEPAAVQREAAQSDRSGGSGEIGSLVEVERRRGLLVRLAYRFCWNRDDAEDAVQNALLQATRGRDQLQDDRRLWSWVRSIVVRQCHDLRRRASAGRRAEAVLKERLGHAPAAVAAAGESERREFTARLRAAIGELPERQQTAVVLRHLEEMSYPEIAEIMGISESTVRVQVRNGREALRRSLQEDGCREADR